MKHERNPEVGGVRTKGRGSQVGGPGGLLRPQGRKWSPWRPPPPNRSLTLIKDDFFLVLAQLQKLHGVLQLLFLFKQFFL